MAEFDVVTPPEPVEESHGKDGKPDRPRREQEEVPEMSVEDARAALNALPKPEPEPDSEEHDQTIAQINDTIRSIKLEIEEIKKKIDSAQEGRQSQDSMKEVRDTMSTLKAERDAIRGQLDSMQEETRSAKATLDGYDKSKKALQSRLKYKTADEIETAIKRMESRQQTSSMSLSDEKKLVKEIEQLRQSRKTAAQYVTQEEALGKAKDGYNATRKTETEKRAELRVIQEKIQETHTILEGMNKIREEQGASVNKLYEDKKDLHEKISDSIEEIKAIRKTHSERLDAWHDLRRERIKFKRAMQKAEYMSRQAAKEARLKAFEDEESRKIPFESEMVLCDNLVSYLETTFLKGEVVKPVAATSTPTGAADSAVFEGLTMVVKKRQDEDFISMGGKKKKGGSKKKAGGKNASVNRQIIVHAIDTLESFALLSISPPPNKAAVPDAIKALKKKKDWFKEQPRTTTAKQSSPKGTKKQAPKEKVKPPEINDEEFPSLPGMLKAVESAPIVEGDELDGDVIEQATNGDLNEATAEGDIPLSAASVVANGVSGKAVVEAGVVEVEEQLEKAVDIGEIKIDADPSDEVAEASEAEASKAEGTDTAGLGPKDGIEVGND